MSQILLAAVLLISGNTQLFGLFDPKWSEIRNGEALCVIPDVFLLLIAISSVLWFGLEHAPVGRYLLAAGGNSEAGKALGAPVDETIWGSIVAIGFIAGVASIAHTMRTVFDARLDQDCRVRRLPGPGLLDQSGRDRRRVAGDSWPPSHGTQSPKDKAEEAP